MTVSSFMLKQMATIISYTRNVLFWSTLKQKDNSGTLVLCVTYWAIDVNLPKILRNIPTFSRKTAWNLAFLFSLGCSKSIYVTQSTKSFKFQVIKYTVVSYETG